MNRSERLIRGIWGITEARPPAPRMIQADDETVAKLNLHLMKDPVPGTIPAKFVAYQPGNKDNIFPGLYCGTTVTPEEYDDSFLIRSNLGIMIRNALLNTGVTESDQQVKITKEYVTKEGKLFLAIQATPHNPNPQ